MRLGVVTTSYPRFAGDAAGSFVAAHARWLAAAGHDVEVIAAGVGVREPDVRDPDEPRIAIRRVPAPPGLFYAGGAPDAVEAGGRIADAVRFSARLALAVAASSPRWDATCAHWLAPPALAAIASRGPLLAIAHGGDVHLLARARLLPAALALLAARGARLAFVSRGLEQRALGALPPRLRRRLPSIVQPMGIDAARFAAIARRRRPRPDGAPATIAVLARLVPIKGVAVAIDALRQVRTPARLVVAGDGPLRRELTARASGLPVDFVGALGADERDALLACADVVVVPSIEAGRRSEGMPMVALEALAARVPLVVSATGGLADLPPDAAWQTVPGDAAAVAGAIDAALAALAPAGVSVPDWNSAGARLWAHWLHRSL
jgi:glycosyltransferase involved in cell wall biosynthesis